tara:strand:- start:417 stop:839 length:423 start_codon:yes stop_codon:yes gene_type:complete
LNKKIKKNFLATIIIKSIINNMIPTDKNNNMPKASEAIQMKKFLQKILKNKILKKNLDRAVYLAIKNKKNDYEEIIKKIPSMKSVTAHIEENLLEFYFTSKIVRSRLSKTTRNFLKIYKPTKVNKLIGLVKRFKLKYREI